MSGLAAAVSLPLLLHSALPDSTTPFTLIALMLYGVVAPAGTPAPVVARIHALTQDMLKYEPAQKAMAGAGLELMNMSQAGFADFVKAEYVRWEKIVKDAGVEKE